MFSSNSSAKNANVWDSTLVGSDGRFCATTIEAISE
jgi:hypothetical protein